MNVKTILRVLGMCVAAVFLTPIPGMATGLPCSSCGPGAHWIHSPPCAAGTDTISDQGAVVGIDLEPIVGGDADCNADQSYILWPCSPGNPLQVQRSGPLDDSARFTGLRPVDGHLDVIDTELLSMCLTDGGGLYLRAGYGQGGIINHSYGAIAEDAGDPAYAESFFDVYFEVTLPPSMGGMTLYNQQPLRISQVIGCAPPKATYIHPTDCLALWTDPHLGSGVHVANLVSAEHCVNEPCIPTVTEWGLIVMTLLLLTAGTVVFKRSRARGVAGAAP